MEWKEIPKFIREDMVHECFFCKEELDLCNDNWDIGVDHDGTEKDILFHDGCVTYFNPDEPNLMVEELV